MRRLVMTLEYCLFWILKRGQNILSDFFYQLSSPEWIRHVIINDPNVLKIEWNILFSR